MTNEQLVKGYLSSANAPGDEFLNCSVCRAGVVELFRHFPNDGTQGDIQLVAVAVSQLVQFLKNIKK